MAERTGAAKQRGQFRPHLRILALHPFECGAKPGYLSPHVAINADSRRDGCVRSGCDFRSPSSNAAEYTRPVRYVTRMAAGRRP